jgi:hypothetical protein
MICRINLICSFHEGFQRTSLHFEKVVTETVNSRQFTLLLDHSNTGINFSRIACAALRVKVSPNIDSGGTPLIDQVSNPMGHGVCLTAAWNCNTDAIPD